MERSQDFVVVGEERGESGELRQCFVSVLCFHRLASCGKGKFHGELEAGDPLDCEDELTHRERLDEIFGDWKAFKPFFWDDDGDGADWAEIGDPIDDVVGDVGSQGLRDIFEVDDESKPCVFTSLREIQGSDDLIDVFERYQVEMLQFGKERTLIGTHVDLDHGSESLRADTHSLHDAFIVTHLRIGSLW
jgi:hypothetical protein